MKKKLLCVAMSLLIASLYSCKSNHTEDVVENQKSISADKLSKIKSLGFSTDNVKLVEGGYLVENDILLTEQNLNETFNGTNLNIANTEQYRTTNIVKYLPRVITVSVTNLPQVYADAVDIMISRYNALGLRLKFQRAVAGVKGNIDVIGFNRGVDANGFITLGQAGFPTSSGQPWNQISMNTNVLAYGTNPNVNYVASVLQHEVGHCIGFRHTDYMDRRFSCGLKGAGNEGSAGFGAVRIPGTPSSPDAGSFMLACADGNRTFNANDIVALNYLYK